MADALFTYRELTRLFPVREGTLRCWVSEDQIKGHRRGRQKVYSHDDIQAAWNKRHPEPKDTPWATGTSPSTDTASTTTASTTTPSNA